MRWLCLKRKKDIGEETRGENEELDVCINGFSNFICAGEAGAVSYSDNFDDEIMNPMLWVYSIEENVANTNLYEYNGVLNLTSIGLPDFSSRHYLSTWILDLSNDFVFKADFIIPIQRPAERLK